ncbi:MAG: hypothetical protein GWO11_03910 [Desulfuromonadales bacterium]|nr:hypothetical protein [Desulfuromonadales bacterium]NIR33583.1 hypothetical protein [Desulfuromonadales bacterium]NIS41174.1 hypothetical protein [Desulfuromonadales bacterium]
MHLISLQLRRYFDKTNFYFVGQAAGAYEGDAGGYASGLVGPGYQWNLSPGSVFAFRSEILLGAGGGGGLDVGGGMVVQPAVGLSYCPTSSVSAGLTLGHIFAPDGNLDSHLIGLHVSTPFILPVNTAEQ